MAPGRSARTGAPRRMPGSSSTTTRRCVLWATLRRSVLRPDWRWRSPRGALSLARAQNSTLVLTADTRSRDPKEPDGTAGTLWGKIDPKSFGDRVVFSKPAEGDAKKCVRRLLLSPAARLTSHTASCVTQAPEEARRRGAGAPEEGAWQCPGGSEEATGAVPVAPGVLLCRPRASAWPWYFAAQCRRAWVTYRSAAAAAGVVCNPNRAPFPPPCSAALAPPATC